MYRIRNSNVYMIEDSSELPEFSGLKTLYQDVETTGLNPWLGARVIGISCTADDNPASFYVPIRHLDKNVDLEAVVRWQKDLMQRTPIWVNHNIKFDASMLLRDGIEPHPEMQDTLVLAKMYDTDRGRYGLKTLCRELLGMEMAEADEVKQYLARFKKTERSFQRLPPDVLGQYAGMDTIGNRALHRFLLAELAPEMQELWRTEVALTRILWEAEEAGFPVDRKELIKESVVTLQRIVLLEAKITELSGREFSNTATWMYDYLINYLGLPVLAYNDKTKRPTFDKKALVAYMEHPDVYTKPEILEVVKAIRAYRTEAQYFALFLSSFTELSDESGRIHPTYNQIVRTGRMSSREPNIQQQNKRSKALFHPQPGRCFISCDYSQIEFRLIAHYAQDEDIIRAYNEDPDTCFHTLSTSLIYNVPLAKVTKAQRKKGKTMNFAIGYGAGKKKVIATLAADKDILEEAHRAAEEALSKRRDIKPEDREVFRAQYVRDFAVERAEEVYQNYHDRMPGIRAKSNLAKKSCEKRGYVFNAYGRRRHLPPKMSRKAFNSVVQGCAMDIIKERMVAAHSDSVLRARGVRIAANVHDEILFDAPEDCMMDTELHDRILSILECPRITFRVPIRAGLGVSKTSWMEAAGDDPIRDADGRVVAGKLR